tara:strand:+ start:532 stop:774 length:243 start_codon:yes stop_codon:yes gene_type:complete
MTKRRIKNKHAHHEQVLRNKIELEVQAKYINRIDYLVGANNELYRDLLKAEQTLEEIEKEKAEYVCFENSTADNLRLEDF